MKCTQLLIEGSIKEKPNDRMTATLYFLLPSLLNLGMSEITLDPQMKNMIPENPTAFFSISHEIEEDRYARTRVNPIFRW